MNSTEYPVQVRLSTVGTGEMKAELGNLAGVARVLQGSINDAANSGQRLSTTFRQTTADGSKFSLTMREMKDSTKQAQGGVEDLNGSAVKMSTVFGAATAALAMFTAGVYAVVEGLKSVIQPGLEFNSFLEKNRLAISALSLTFGTYQDEMGQTVTGTKAWSMASADAANQQQLLMRQSMQSAASFQDLAGVYQMIYGAMVAGGAKNAQEMVQFTGTVADMAAVMGTSYDKAARQMSLALMGATRTTGQLGAMLKTMGIDNATLQSWRQQGIIVEELQKKLHAFLEMQPQLQNTWVGITTNMKTAWQLFTGAVTEDVFGPLKAQMQTLLHDVLDFTTGKLSQAAADIGKALSEGIAGSFKVAISAITSSFGVVDGVLKGHALTWLDIFKGVAEGMVFVTENIAKALLFVTSAAAHPIDMLMHAATEMLETFYDALANLMKGIAVVAGSPVGETLGFGAGTSAVAATFAAGLERASTALKMLDVLANPTTKKLADGFAAIDAQVLKAYTDIQKVGIRNILDVDSPMTSPGSGGTYNPTKPTVDMSKFDEAARKYANAIQSFFAKTQGAGLEGLDAALAKNEQQFQQTVVQIDNFTQHMEAAAIKAHKPELFDALEAMRLALFGVAREARDANNAREVEKFAQQFEDAVSKMNTIAMNDNAIDKFVGAWESNLRKLNDDFVKAKAALGSAPLFDFTDPQSIADAMAYYEKLGRMNAAYADAVQRNDAVLALNTQKINAEKQGNYQQYYDAVKQLAVNAGRSEFQAAQEAAQKSAEMLNAQADTAAKGFKAGMASIYASMKAFGQDVSSLMTSVWGDLTKSFEDGFYDILTGKFDDLSNVLKSLWDSILKDFSKMLAQMLERWLLTGDAMGSGQGNGGILGSLLGGGSSAVYTPQGTGYANGGTIDATTDRSGGGNVAAGGGGGGSSLAGYAALAGAAVLTFSALKNGFGKTPGSDVSYNGTSLGQSTDFGGTAKFGDFVTAATSVVAASAMAVAATAAAGAAIVPVWGWIAAAAILIVGAIVSIINGPKEGHFYVAISDAFDKSGARSAVGGFVNDVMESTANFVGDLAMKAAGPEAMQKYQTAYNKAFKDALGNAKFDFHAGSGDDLNKDVTDFFNKTLPKLAMQAAFGQVGIGQPNGASAIAGMDWNTNNGTMDSQGNWIKHQLFDPNAPIPALLSGIGFSADEIGLIATKLSTSTDMAAFKQYLLDLVGIVAGFADLARQTGRAASEWRVFFAGQSASKGTAAEFASGVATLKGSGLGLENLTGDEQVAAAKQLLQDAGTLMGQLASALQSIFNMIDQIQATTKATIQSYLDKLLTPAQLEAQARASVGPDMAAIAKAANPAEVQAAWQQVMKDLSQVLDAIVARIQAIKALQQSYADFRTQMAKDAGPQFATDPAAWLAQNQAAINAVTATLETATGDDAIAGARTLLQLTQDRYNNELAMLGRVNAAIESISETHDTTNQNLTMQGMGHVEVDPQTGKKTWVADVHAQGDYLKGQYDQLVGSLATAKTPEEVQKIYSKIQSVISQLAAQPQDPAHYAESRQILQGLNDSATKAAQDILKKWGTDLSLDLATTGDKLTAGEAALAKGLDAAQKDFDKYLKLMDAASVNATVALNVFADGIISVMNDLSKYFIHWQFIMSHTSGELDPGWDYAKNQPKDTTKTPISGGGAPATSLDVWVDDPTDPTMEVCISGPDKGKKRVKATKQPGSGPGGPGHGPDTNTIPPANVTVTVNSGSPEEIAAAAANAVYGQTLSIVQQSQVALVKAIRTNPTLTTPAWSSR